MVNSVLKTAECDSAPDFAKITRAHAWITFLFIQRQDKQ